MGYLIINWIVVEDQKVLVGATDQESWAYEKDLGKSGADAASHVYVTLTDNGEGRVVTEEAGFNVSRTEHTLRGEAYEALYGLFEAAWFIKNHLDESGGRARFMGTGA